MQEKIPSSLICCLPKHIDLKIEHFTRKENKVFWAEATFLSKLSWFLKIKWHILNTSVHEWQNELAVRHYIAKDEGLIPTWDSESLFSCSYTHCQTTTITSLWIIYFQNLVPPGCRKKNFPTVHRSGCSVENFHGKNLTTLHYSKQNWCTYIKINFY